MALSVLLGATFIGTINNSIANIAVPYISKDLSVDLSTGVWVIFGFSLALGTFMTVAGRLGDMYGSRRIFLIGLAMFAVASVIVAIGDNIVIVVLGRVLQGAASAPVLPCILATIARLFPVEQRGAAVSLWAAVNASALAAGPAIGGVIVETLGWRAIFFITAPAAVVVWILVLRLVPIDEPSKPQEFDALGAMLVATTIASFSIPITQIPRWGWLDPRIAMWLSVAMSLGFLLKRHLSTTLNPFLDPKLFANSRIWLVTAMASLQMVVLFAVTFSVPVFLVVGIGRNAGTAGLVTSVLPGSMLVGAAVSGRLSRRVTLNRLINAGTLIMTGGIVIVGIIAPALGGVVIGLVFIGIGISLIQAPAAVAVTLIAPAGQTSATAGLFNTARFVMGGIGAAAAAALFDHASGRGSAISMTPDRALSGLRAGLGLTLAACFLIAMLSLVFSRLDMGGEQDQSRT